MIVMCSFLLGIIIGSGLIILGVWINGRINRQKLPENHKDSSEKRDIQEKLMRQYRNLLSYDGRAQRGQMDED